MGVFNPVKAKFELLLNSRVTPLIVSPLAEHATIKYLMAVGKLHDYLALSLSLVIIWRTNSVRLFVRLIKLAYISFVHSINYSICDHKRL